MSEYLIFHVCDTLAEAQAKEQSLQRQGYTKTKIRTGRSRGCHFFNVVAKSDVLQSGYEKRK